MPSMGRAVRGLLIASVVLFLAQLVAEQWFEYPLSYLLGFVPKLLLEGWIWQPFTYAFLHSGVLHMVFNLLVVWSIGSELEESWGSKFFLVYFFVCTLGAAITYGLFTALGISGSTDIPVVGSSGAVYGFLLAYGLLFGDRVLYFFMIFPMRAKYFVLILGAIVLVSTIFYSKDGVAHAAHLGGMVAGFSFLSLYALWRRRMATDHIRRRDDAARAKRVQKAQHLRMVKNEGGQGSEGGDPPVWH